MSRASRGPVRVAGLGAAALALAAALLAAATAAGEASCPPASRLLVVEDLARGALLGRECVRAGQRFTLEYVHSSERVPVRGIFLVDDGPGFVVVATAFAGFGPGLPALTPGDDWEIRDGRIVARTARRLEDLTVRVLPSTRHRLVTPQGVELDLSAGMGPGGPVRVSVR